MDKVTSCHKVGVFCWLFLPRNEGRPWKESLKGTSMKGKPRELLSWLLDGAAHDVPSTTVYDHIIDW